jgi:monofunctional biosynthetic peptidoglycan transglycosylase
MFARVRQWTVRAALMSLRAVALFVACSVVQVTLVRFVDPPATLTMLERARENFVTSGRVEWVDVEPVSLASLGPTVPRAFLASEDARFYLHHGFDWTAVCAAWRSNGEGRSLRGGSTLTQQVAKNVFLWQHRSWVRKALEAWYTFLLELLLPKDRILELYLNVAETGPMVFGVEAGARRHFQRSASELSAEQAGRLAGVLPDPRRRSVRGAAASARAAFIAANPAPLPGDPAFDRIRAAFLAEPGWRACRP